MDNKQFNYKIQCEEFHKDTISSKEKDIKNITQFLENHDAFPKNHKCSILDLGCGMGRLLLALKRKGYLNLKGVDIDQGQVEVARREGLDIELSDVITFLKKCEKKYDVIYAMDILEHIDKEKQVEFLKLIKKCLSKEGFVMIEMPNADAPLSNHLRFDDFTHVVSFTPRAFGFIAKNAGFEHFLVRPQHEESFKIRSLKSIWAKLYKYEFSENNPILTFNLICMLFNEKRAFDDYLQKAPIIINDYSVSCFDKAGEDRLHYPKWLRKLICCFIPRRKNRRKFMKKYVK